MTPAALQKLHLIYNFVSEQLKLGTRPAIVIDTLIRAHGATVAFTGGANTIRVGGVSGSCTSDADKGLLASWHGCAKRRLGREGRL